MSLPTIQYPYLPKGVTIRYVPASDPFMKEAAEYGEKHSLDDAQKTGVVLVKDGVIIAYGANGSDYHKTQGCERRRLNVPTGTGYELCEGCHPKNHAEARALADAHKRGSVTHGAEAVLWGHWWACESCWDTLLGAGIKTLVLMEGSERLFNRTHPDNVLV